MADNDSTIKLTVEVDQKSSQKSSREFSKRLTTDMKNASKTATKVFDDQNKKNATKEAKEAKAYKNIVSDQNRELNKQVGILNRINSVWDKINTKSKKSNGPGGPPPSGGPSGSGGGSGPNKNKDEKGIGDRIADSIKIAVAGAVGGYMGMGLKTFFKGFEEKVAFEKNLSQVAFMGQNQFGGIRDRAFDRFSHGARYGYGASDTLGHAASLGRATGGIGLLSAIQAQSRERGMDVGSLTGFAGTLTRAGTNVNTEAGKRTFTKIMEQSVRSGLDKSRTGEHLDAVASLVSQGQSSSAGEVASSSISSMLASLGSKLGPGFQGERGAATLSRFDQAIKGGGGGEAGQAFIMQALGFGRPGGGSSFGDVTRRMQRGILGGTGGQGAQNFVDLLNYAKQTTGGGEETSFLLSKMTGESMDRIDALLTAFQGPDGFAALTKEIDKQKNEGKSDIEKLSKAVEEFTSIARFDATQMNARMNEVTDKTIQQVEELQKAFQDLALTLAPLLTQVVSVMNALKPAIDKLTEVLGPVMERAAHGLEMLMERLPAPNASDRQFSSVDTASLQRAGIISYSQEAAADMRRNRGNTYQMTQVPGFDSFVEDEAIARNISSGALSRVQNPTTSADRYQNAIMDLAGSDPEIKEYLRIIAENTQQNQQRVRPPVAGAPAVSNVNGTPSR